jgi:hypothetical protein
MSNLWKIKGQGLVGEIILFSVSIFFAFTIFIILSSGDAEFDRQAERTVEAHLEMVKQRSALTQALEDKVKKQVQYQPGFPAHGDADDEPYGKISAFKLASYYLSTVDTPGEDKIFIRNSSYTHEKINETLGYYFKSKLRSSIQPGGADKFSFRMVSPDGDDNVKVEGLETVQGDLSVLRLPLELSDNRSTTFRLRVQSQGGAFGVQ